MKKKYLKRGIALLMGAVLCFQNPIGSFSGTGQDTYAATAATVNASTLNVRSGPGTSSSLVTKLARGTAVTILGETTASDGKLWYQIQFSGSGGTALTGYALATYIRIPVAYSTDSSFESQLAAQGFPESYKPALRELHAQYPNWVFRAQQTGLDWNTVIQNESVVGRNLVGSTSISSWKSIASGAYNWDSSSWPGFDGSTWVAASEDVIRYYMDPRNFLDEIYIFQFLTHTYDGTVHTREGLQSMVQGTFLDTSARLNDTSNTGTDAGDTSGTGAVTPAGGATDASQGTTSQTPADMNGDAVRLQGPQASISRNEVGFVGATEYGPGMNVGSGSSSASSSSSVDYSGTSDIPYVDLIMQAGVESGVNPYVLAAMILQEQGRNGSGASISGTSGYYNYYNVGAFQSGTSSAVSQGISYAAQSGSYQRPWNTPAKAIIGGAIYYSTNYVQAGQDTFYLKKFNVQGSNLYKHQYMTNVQAAASEAALYAEAYTRELKQTALEFKIPVYTNMPDTACARPTLDGSPNNKLSGLGVEGFALTPTFNRDTESYDLIVDYSVESVNIQAAAIDSKASVSGTGTIQIQSGINTIPVNVKAENGTVRQYVINVVRQNNGPTYSAGVGGVNVQTGSQSSGSSGSSGSDSTGGPGVRINPDGSSSSGSVTGSSQSTTSQSSASQSSAGSGNGSDITVSLTGPGM